jgi:uncharacterized membrane protein YkoI
MTRILTLSACLILTVSAFAETRDEISFDDVPENVLDTAIRTAPGVTFDRVSIEVENGVKIYEFEAKDHAGRHIEIDVDENGVLEEIEMETDFDDLPAPVVATLEKTAPGMEPTYIELSVRDGRPAYVYEIEGVVNGRAVDIEIAEDGALLLMSDDLSS